MSQVIEITEAAAARIAELQEAGGGKAVRLGVKPSGCSGIRYDLAYCDVPGALDEMVEAFGATIYVDALSLAFIAGTKIDWAESGLRRAFTFDNPNETGRCGCGESFATA